MMEAQESSIQYNRWSNSQDEVSMNMTASRGVDYEGICTKLCTGKLGITMKVAGGIVLFWVIFIIGYITGYYTHKCK
ncbi:small integral membrane protein 1 [Notamacropus eugenii]|uniref:small integral membrane protein 1 n=1 Tax=Notamacropus eugenii TaxID=9315 RepID=UPI003B66DB18